MHERIRCHAGRPAPYSYINAANESVLSHRESPPPPTSNRASATVKGGELGLGWKNWALQGALKLPVNREPPDDG